MIHLIWTIANGLMLLYFIYLLFGFIFIGKKIFKPKFKSISIVFLLIGVVQILSASDRKYNTNNNLIEISNDFDKHKNVKSKRIILEKNIVFDINLNVRYSKNELKYIPIESYSLMTGLISGYVWEFKSIETESIMPNNIGKYKANGILKWNFFGITVYSQLKTFEGEINYNDI